MIENETAGTRLAPSNRPTRNTVATSSDLTAQPDPTATRQRAGQLRRAQALDEQADRLHALGDFRAARRLRHEAHQLRRLARPQRPAPPAPIDVASQLAVGRLEQWAARSAA